MAEFYTTARIIDTVRRLMDDRVQPYFVDDDTLLIFLNDRQRELVHITLCLVDSRNIQLPVKADDAWVYPPKHVIKPIAGVSQTTDKVLSPIPRNKAERLYDYSDYGFVHSDAWRRTTGTPEYLITDMDNDAWRLMPVPTVDDTLTIEAYVFPDYLTCADDDPSVPDTLAEGLHKGVLASAFAIEDADAIYDPRKAEDYTAQWEKFKYDAAARFQRDQRSSGRAVKYGGY